MVACPICDQQVSPSRINDHIDSDCKDYIEGQTPPATQQDGIKPVKSSTKPAAAFFTVRNGNGSFTENASQSLAQTSSPITHSHASTTHTPSHKPASSFATPIPTSSHGTKRHAEDVDLDLSRSRQQDEPQAHHQPKKARLNNQKSAPLADRMRPRTLSEITGQALVGPNGVLRNLISTSHVPSMILWGGPGTGKTTIARLIASTAETRFVEINSTSSGVAECKRLFGEARNELGLTGRRTIIFCDEIHRFSKSQQDVFLGPVESGTVTLIGATTENPSFKVVNALLSRCRVFTLDKLGDGDVEEILKRALTKEVPGVFEEDTQGEDKEERAGELERSSYHLLKDDDYALVRYLAAFADGDARTGLNLLELALDLCREPGVTTDEIKKSLTQTLVYDRAGDQHYDTISAFHKSVRGGDADAALYYLARMLQSGEDPLYVARRMIVIASEDVGLADNSMLSLATATYTAAEKIGMPECRINLGHCAIALALSPKSVRAYRGLSAAYGALQEPGIAGLPIPYHIRNAPTRLMKDLGYGKEYKYNPDFVDGRVMQDYLPEKLEGRKFLGSKDLGDKIDPEITAMDEHIQATQDAEKARQRYVNDDGELILNPDGD